MPSPRPWTVPQTLKIEPDNGWVGRARSRDQQGDTRVVEACRRCGVLREALLGLAEVEVPFCKADGRVAPHVWQFAGVRDPARGPFSISVRVARGPAGKNGSLAAS